MSRQKKIRVVSGYSRPHTLANLDRRTKEAHFVEAVRAELFAHVGGNPSVIERALIERAAWLSLRCSILDEKIRTSNFNQHDNNFVLAWNNALTRTLTRLGLKGPAQPPGLALDAHIAKLRDRRSHHASDGEEAA